MANHRNQLDLPIDAKYTKAKENRAWLQAFYARAYAEGKAAGERAAEERLRLELELALAPEPR